MKKSSSVILILSIIGLIISLAPLGIKYLLPSIIKMKQTNYNTIGIIGGSDGPTAILLSPSHGITSFLLTLIGICSIIGIIYYIYQYKKNK